MLPALTPSSLHRDLNCQQQLSRCGYPEYWRLGGDYRRERKMLGIRVIWVGIVAAMNRFVLSDLPGRVYMYSWTVTEDA
jgi:hypothetical protein